jgi:hypothetical protein
MGSARRIGYLTAGGLECCAVLFTVLGVLVGHRSRVKHGHRNWAIKGDGRE